jgi:hypothetical protein
LQKWFPHFAKFLKAKGLGSPDSYLDFISVAKDGFITRLVTCEKCLSAWLAAIHIAALWVFWFIFYGFQL